MTDEQKQEVMRRQYEWSRAMSKEAMLAIAAAQMRCIGIEELAKRQMAAMQNMNSLYATQPDYAVRAKAADEPKTMIGRILKRLQFI